MQSHYTLAAIALMLAPRLGVMDGKESQRGFPWGSDIYGGLKSEMQHPTWIALSVDCGLSLFGDTLHEVAEGLNRPGF